MVGEVSPDGNFVWNGESWVPKDEYIPSPEATEETTNNVFQLGEQDLAGDVGWEPVTEKSSEGGKGQIDCNEHCRDANSICIRMGIVCIRNRPYVIP